jgi:ATP-dependent DNA helicase RecG
MSGQEFLEQSLAKTFLRRLAKKFATELEIETVGQLLRHFPRRYEERGELTPLDSLAEGEYVTVQAEILRAKIFETRARKKLMKVQVTDGRRTMSMTLFNAQPYWLKSWMVPGRRGYFTGKVNRYGKNLELLHPHTDFEDEPKEVKGGLIPIYPAASGLTSRKIQTAIEGVLALAPPLPEPLPDSVIEEFHLVPFHRALRLIHNPSSRADVEIARKRFKWEEAFLLQATFAQRRHQAQADPATPRPRRSGGLLEAFDQRCPFPLTEGQQEIGDLLAEELAQPHPMNRLLQGEVGSGKTVVALRAMLTVLDTGGQAAMLAPTEVLAYQHARSLRQLLGPLAGAGELGGAERATSVVVLTGSQSPAQRRKALAAIADGSAGIAVGTHALLEEGVQFRDLGLVVVDEQHRFGVEQRDTLRAKGANPHVLVLTATPIPRTVAITVFGDLEVSSLTELPAGRSPIDTRVVPVVDHPKWMARVWQRVREEVEAGHQVYIVCPLISADDKPGPENIQNDEKPKSRYAVLNLLPELEGGALFGLRLAALHGRMGADEKDAVMSAFARGQVDVLIATTVIEVGVDVANATGMVVLDADRFGISQLHQLRGRVGRGSAASICLLVTSEAAASPARRRLEAVASTADGFELAELDLAERREGDVLGTVQAGRKRSLRFLELRRDADLIRAARERAFRLVGSDPELHRHPVLAQALRFTLEEKAVYLEKA